MTLKTVQRTIEHYKLLSTNQTLIIGVSGGTDSLALLHMMKQLQIKLEINIHVATFNHGIRGQDSEDDTRFVQAMAEQWDVPYTVGYANVPHLAKQMGVGIEAAGRQARYDFFAEVATEVGARVIAVAHHANDQAETILMHIVRGSGLKGLRGMQPKSPLPYHSHLTLIRPLLHLSRTKLEYYCAKHSLTPRHDTTNDDTDYQRNFIRHKIMPQLRKLNPNVTASLGRLGENATIDEAYLNYQLDDIVTQFVELDDKRWHIPAHIIAELHPALQRRYLIKAFDRLNQSDVQLSAVNILNAIDILNEMRVGTIVDLGVNIRLRVGYDAILIEDVNHPIDTGEYRLIPQGTYLEMAIPSHVSLGEISITLANRLKDHTHSTVVILPNDVSLVLRTRQAGDKFRPLGMNGHSRKIKDWMIDRKIPRHFRNNIPLVCANDNIVAVCVGETWHLADLSQFIVNENRRIYLILA